MIMRHGGVCVIAVISSSPLFSDKARSVPCNLKKYSASANYSVLTTHDCSRNQNAATCISRRRAAAPPSVRPTGLPVIVRLRPRDSA